MNRLEYLKTRFAEEALETAHAMQKVLAFGETDCRPGTDVPNCYEVHKEFQELIAVKEMLEDEGVKLSFSDSEEIRTAKKERVEKFLGYSRNRGRLLDDRNGFYAPSVKCLPDRVFVFGSNLAGRHGAGAAKDALGYHGALYGLAEGIQGMSYGIATKDEHLKSRSLEDIQESVKTFVEFTHVYPLYFYVTALGTGYAGYEHEQIAPMFKGAKRCLFPQAWEKWLKE